MSTTAPTPHTFGNGLTPLPWNGQQIFCVVFAPVLAFYVVYGAIAVVRRNYLPLRAREPFLVLGLDIVTALLSFVFLWKMLFQADWPCVLHVLDSHIGINLLCLLYIARAWLLLVAHNKNVVKTAIGKAQDRKQLEPLLKNIVGVGTGTADYKWWARVKFSLGFASRRLIFLLITGAAAVLIIPVFFLLKTSAPPTFFFDTYGCNISPSAGLLSAELVMYAICFIFLAVLFRDKAEDNMGIKWEMRLTGIAAILGVIPFAIFSIVNSLKAINADVFRVSAAVPLVIMAFLFVIRTIKPVHESWHLGRTVYLRRSPSFKLEQATEMKIVLTSSAGFVAFSDFLAREFAVENILFWDEVRTFRRQSDPEQGLPTAQVVDKALDLFEKYVKEGSIAQVNLTFGVAESIRGRLDAAVADMDAVNRGEFSKLFVEAERHIFNLMLQDPYPRFVRSEDFIPLKASVDKLKREYAELGPKLKLVGDEIQSNMSLTGHGATSRPAGRESDSQLARESSNGRAESSNGGREESSTGAVGNEAQIELRHIPSGADLVRQDSLERKKFVNPWD